MCDEQGRAAAIGAVERRGAEHPPPCQAPAMAKYDRSAPTVSGDSAREHDDNNTKAKARLAPAVTSSH